MHVEGIIHRDLKPGNIFLARNKIGEIVPPVLDFGIARSVAAWPFRDRTREGVVVGTPTASRRGNSPTFRPAMPAVGPPMDA